MTKKILFLSNANTVLCECTAENGKLNVHEVALNLMSKGIVTAMAAKNVRVFVEDSKGTFSSSVANLIDEVVSRSVSFGEHLTGRQKHIAQLVCDGMVNKEIAPLVGITERTVKFHISVMLKKFRCHNRIELGKRLRLGGYVVTRVGVDNEIKSPLGVVSNRGRRVVYPGLSAAKACAN